MTRLVLGEGCFDFLAGGVLNGFSPWETPSKRLWPRTRRLLRRSPRPSRPGDNGILKGRTGSTRCMLSHNISRYCKGRKLRVLLASARMTTCWEVFPHRFGFPRAGSGANPAFHFGREPSGTRTPRATHCKTWTYKHIPFSTSQSSVATATGIGIASSAFRRRIQRRRRSAIRRLNQEVYHAGVKSVQVRATRAFSRPLRNVRTSDHLHLPASQGPTCVVLRGVRRAL